MNRYTIALWVAVLASREASAQTSPDETRRELLRQAQEASDAGDPAQAVSLAERAGEIRMHPSLRYFIAEQQKKLGEVANSLNSAKLCVLEATQAKQLKNRAEILRRCNDFLAEPQKSVARVVISFAHPVPPQTEVRVGEQPVPELMYGRPFFLNAGQVRIQAEAPGYVPFNRELTLLAGEEVAVSVSMAEISRKPEVIAPSLAEPIPNQVPPSELVVSSSVPKPSGGSTGPYVLLGAGAASLGASVLFLTLRNSQVHKLEAQCADSICPDIPAVHSLQTSASRYNLWTNVALGVGCAAVAGGALWLILEKTRSSPTAARATLQVMPTQAGAQVAIAGAF